MSDPNIIFPIKTTGADEAVAEINKVKGASESVTKGQLAPGNSLGPRDDAGRERAIRDVQALTDKAKVAEIAYYNLGEALDEDFKKILRGTDAAAVSVQKLDRTAQGSTGGLSKTGFIANNVSMQVGDFTQQVTGGTSALRAFSQQAPQLIGTFTSMGLVTGGVGMAIMAVGALLPIITAGFSALSASFGAVSETADEAKTRIEDLGKAFEKSTTGKLSKLKDDLALAEEVTGNLRTNLSGLHQAENEAAKTTLSNAAAIAAAEEKVNVIFGIRVDQFAKIKTANEEARKARELELKAAQQAAEDERKKRQDEIDTLTKTRDALQADLERRKANYEKGQAQVADLESRRAKAQAIAKGTGSTMNLTPGFGGYSPAQEAEIKRRKDAAAEAQTLDQTAQVGASNNGTAAGIIKGLENKLQGLSSKIEGASNQLAIDQQAAETKLGALIQTQETSKVVELVDTAKKNQDLVTESAQKIKADLEAAAAKQGGLSASAATALATIVKQLENNVIDPAEMQAFSTAFAQAKASREASAGMILGSVAQLQASDIEIRNALSTMQKQFEEMKRAIK